MIDNFSIPTRQDADVLFGSNVPLGAGKSFQTPVARVAGYAQIEILAVSDQPFTLSVEEAVSVDAAGRGRFVQDQPLLSSALVLGQSQISIRIPRFGVFMKMTLANTGAPETFLSFAVQGLPVS